MEANEFYARVSAILELPPEERHRQLLQLHDDILKRYLPLIQGMDLQFAQRIGHDGRTVAQLVGHIAEWERYTIQAAAEMVCGAAWPRIMQHSGYLEADGTELNFTDVDEFNAYQAGKHAAMPWEQIQQLALQTAPALYAFFSHPALLPAERLEGTHLIQWGLPGYEKRQTSLGWSLWVISLEHLAVAHAEDLGWQERASGTGKP